MLDRCRPITKSDFLMIVLSFLGNFSPSVPKTFIYCLLAYKVLAYLLTLSSSARYKCFTEWIPKLSTVIINIQSQCLASTLARFKSPVSTILVIPSITATFFLPFRGFRLFTSYFHWPSYVPIVPYHTSKDNETGLISKINKTCLSKIKRWSLRYIQIFHPFYILLFEYTNQWNKTETGYRIFKNHEIVEIMRMYRT